MTSLGWHPEQIELTNPEELIPVPIVADAAVATVQVKGGILIPVLLIDTSSRPDIEKLVRLHTLHHHTGECKSGWGYPDATKNVDLKKINLILQFLNPSKCTVILEFDILKQGGVVDQIVQAEALYLQPARPGERFGNNINREKILVEVPSKNFAGEWNVMFDSVLKEDIRKKGLDRKEAQEFVRKFKESWRETWRKMSKGLR